MGYIPEGWYNDPADELRQSIAAASDGEVGERAMWWACLDRTLIDMLRVGLVSVPPVDRVHAREWFVARDMEPGGWGWVMEVLDIGGRLLTLIDGAVADNASYQPTDADIERHRICEQGRKRAYRYKGDARGRPSNLSRLISSEPVTS